MQRAERTIPGGVSSYARKFDRPLSFDYGRGSKVYEIDGTEYVDYLQAWGAIILGHCHDQVTDRVAEVIGRQDLYGMGTTELEVEVAEAISDAVPSADRVLFGVTGSEVVARAITLARAVTGRKKIIKFQGHYHGWYDPVAMNHLTDPDHLDDKVPFTEGVLPEVVDQTIVLPFNDEAALETAFEEYGDEIAGIVLEPVAHNMCCVTPREGYLETLRQITNEHGSLLIFDEIITGFRHGMGGVQESEGVTPDLTTLGKSIANGYPMSVLCGKKEYIERFHTTDDGDVAFGGTYSSHAAALAAAHETMRLLEELNFHETASQQSAEIGEALEDIIEDVGLDAHVKHYGPTFLTYFTDKPVHDYRDVLKCDREQYMTYRWEMVNQGVLMIPKNVRRNYLTASHTDEDIQKTIEAAKHALKVAADS
jgi:glutamate-1-semialdehyde 2,1-aminomutase